MRRTCLVLGCLALCLLVLTACGGWHFPTFGFDGGAGSGSVPKPGQGGVLSSRDELARLLTQLQWVFVGLGIAGVVASIWLPIISTRHAVASLAIGVGIGIARPFIIALYWPTVIALCLAALCAVWPYALAVITWFRLHISGGIDRSELTSGWESIKSLWQPRSVANAGVGKGVAGVSGGPVDTGGNTPAQ